jgi:hypothetical protein
MYTLTTRPATKEETDAIVGNTKAWIVNYGCAALFLGGAALSFGAIGGCVGDLISEQAGTIGQWSGWGLGAIILVGFFIGFSPVMRRAHRKALQDNAERVVEEITVTNPRVVEIGLISNDAPILAFQIDAGKLLFLQGQWLVQYDVYGAPPLDVDGPDDVFNGLPPPHSFPSTAFTLRRLPHSGDVLGIRVQGEYLKPEKEVEALRPEFEFAMSELLDGELDEIAAALLREHQRRVK